MIDYERLNKIYDEVYSKPQEEHDLAIAWLYMEVKKLEGLKRLGVDLDNEIEDLQGIIEDISSYLKTYLPAGRFKVIPAPSGRVNVDSYRAKIILKYGGYDNRYISYF